MTEVSTDLVTWGLGAFAAFKAFEPIILRVWGKKETEITTIIKRCECLEKDVLLLQANKVSREELDKKFDKIEKDVSEIKIGLAEITVLLKNREE